MKPIVLASVLALSLTGNVGLLRRRISPDRLSPVRPTPTSSGADTRAGDTNAQKASATNKAETSLAIIISDLWRSHHANPGHFAKALRSAGVPDRLLQVLINAELDEQFRAREQALLPPRKKLKFWQEDDTVIPYETRLAEVDLKREKAKQRRALLGQPSAGDSVDAYDHLPLTKRDLAREIAEDYDAMLGPIREQAGTMPMPAERERIKFLEAERRRDLLAMLTPAELAELDERAVFFAGQLRNELQFLEATPEEFRAIHTAQSQVRPMNSTLAGIDFSPPTDAADFRRQTQEKERVATELKAALGEARYAEYMRAQESGFRRLADLANRNDVSLTAVNQFYDLRTTLTAEAQRIYFDRTLTNDQVRGSLSSLADTARGQAQLLLGKNVASTYLANSAMSRWLDALADGNAVNIRDGGMTTFPLQNRRPNDIRWVPPASIR